MGEPIVLEDFKERVILVGCFFSYLRILFYYLFCVIISFIFLYF